MIAIIDYGMGNLHSVQKALEKVGGQAIISDAPKDIDQAEKVILPGVGAIRPAMSRLQDKKLIAPIQEAIKNNKPFLGICVGFQLLFTTGEEGGIVKTLGVIPGTVKRFTELKVPQMGWNQLHIQQKDCPLFKNITNNSFVYFCHSYYADAVPETDVASTTDYGIIYPSSVCRGNLFGVQFHPEKSQRTGLQILKNFVQYQP